MNKYKIVISSSILVMAICLIVTIVSVTNSTAYAMDKNMDLLMKDINVKIQEKEDMAYSSNPYDYIEKNESYKNIKELKIKALPLLANKIEQSDEAGLEEYIMAIAIQDISGIDVSSLEGEWSDGQEFLREYKAFLRGVKDNVNVIMTSETLTEDEKMEELSKMGIYALPYIDEKSIKEESSKVIKTAKNVIKSEYVEVTNLPNITNTDIEVIKQLVDSYGE